MHLIVRAFPIAPGQEETTRSLAATILGSRRAEAEDFYRRFGIKSESWHMQNTGHGTWVIAVTEIGGPPEEAGKAFAASQAGFERWFKDQVKLCTGIDQDAQPLGPPTETIFDLHM